MDDLPKGKESWFVVEGVGGRLYIYLCELVLKAVEYCLIDRQQ